jgi:hypothetical protein
MFPTFIDFDFKYGILARNLEFTISRSYPQHHGFIGDIVDSLLPCGKNGDLCILPGTGEWRGHKGGESDL